MTIVDVERPDPGPALSPRARRWTWRALVVVAPASLAWAGRGVVAVDGVELAALVYLLVAAGSLLMFPTGLVTARTWVVGYLVLEFPVRALFLLTAPTERPQLYDLVSPGAGLEEALVTALVEALVGLLAMLFAYWLALPRRSAVVPAVVGCDVRRTTAYALLGLGALLLPVELADRGTGTDGGGFILSMPGLAAAGAATAVSYAFVQAPRRNTVLFAAAIAYAGSRVELLGSKLAVLSCVVALVVSYAARSSQRHGPMSAAIRGGLGMALASVVAVYVFAAAAGHQAEGPVVDRLTAGATAAVSRSYGVDALVASDRYLDDGGPHLHGSTLTEVVYSWVPRAFWPEKPKSFSVRFGEEVFGFSTLAGVSFFAPGYSGEWMLNFGLPGLVVGWLLFGAALGRVDAMRSVAHRTMLLVVAVHVVEGSVVAQLWLAAPFLLGSSLVLVRERARDLS